MVKKTKITAISSLILMLCGMASPALSVTDYIRVNQIGYLTTDTKIAVAFAKSSLATLTFEVINASTSAVLWGPTAFPATAMTYAPFNDVYQLNFSAFEPAAAVTCEIKLSDGTLSPKFQVGPCVYQNAEETGLNFFRAQNCGTGNWYDGGVNVNATCHASPGAAGFTSYEDAYVVDGPNKGKAVNVEGGWHDSGDYIKFMITTAWVDYLLLFSYQQNSTVFQDTLGSNLQPNSPNGVPDVLDEARYGLNWIINMNPNASTFYYDVADNEDHNNSGGALPQDDADNYNGDGVDYNASVAPDISTVGNYRSVYGGTNDQGGSNNAARAAAALATAYTIWSASGTTYQDLSFAATCLTHAQWLYALAKSENYTQIDVDGFYGENTYTLTSMPEMELAAVELYNATGTATYLSDAETDDPGVGSANGELDWSQLNFVAHYCLYQASPSFTGADTNMAADLNYDLNTYYKAANNPYGVGYEYEWGTNENLTSLVMMCELYKKANPGVTTYDAMATANRDFLLGCNPWGVCFFQGMGTAAPLYPQHNISMILYQAATDFGTGTATSNTPIPGMPIEGPVDAADYNSNVATGMKLNGTSAYTAFNNTGTGGWVYNDDSADYTSNEPTTTQAGFVVNVFAYLAAACVVVPSPSNTTSPTITFTSTFTPTRTATATPSRTISPTVTASASPSRSPSPSPTLTASPTPTQSGSPSPNASPSMTVTEGSSFSSTESPTWSPTFTETVMETATLSSSSTPTLTPSSSFTPTPSPSVVISASPSPLASASASSTASPTPLPSASPSNSATETLTSTPSPSPSVTWTPSPTETLVLSPTTSQSPSPLSPTPQSTPGIGSLSVTSGPTSGGTKIVVTGLNFSVSMTAKLGGLSVSVTYISPTSIEITSPAHGLGPADLVLTNQPSNLSATKAGAFNYTTEISTINGPIVIDNALPDLDPSPNGPSSFKILFEGGVDTLTLRIYTEGMQCVGNFSAPGYLGSLWQSISIPAAAYNGFAGGLYYYEVTGSRAEVISHHFVGKFYILR